VAASGPQVPLCNLPLAAVWHGVRAVLGRLTESCPAKSVAFTPGSKATLQSVTGRTPPCAPPTANRDEPSGGIISVATPDSAPPLVPLQSEHERLLQHRPAITTLNHPLARRHGPYRRPCARCALPPARPAARAARYAYDASSGRPASPSGGAGRRTSHAPHLLADGRNHRGDALGGPRARGLEGRAGATGATTCRWGLDGPPAAPRTPISQG